MSSYHAPMPHLVHALRFPLSVNPESPLVAVRVLTPDPPPASQVVGRPPGVSTPGGMVSAAVTDVAVCSQARCKRKQSESGCQKASEGRSGRRRALTGIVWQSRMAYCSKASAATALLPGLCWFLHSFSLRPAQKPLPSKGFRLSACLPWNQFPHFSRMACLCTS